MIEFITERDKRKTEKLFETIRSGNLEKLKKDFSKKDMKILSVMNSTTKT